MKKFNLRKARGQFKESLQLELTGPGGGAWRVAFAGDRPVSVETGYCGKPQVLLYGPASVFHAISTGSVPLEDALLAGRLVLRSPGTYPATAERLVRSLLTSIRTLSPTASRHRAA